MNSFIVFASVLAVASAGQIYLGGGSPLVYSGASGLIGAHGLIGAPGLLGAPGLIGAPGLLAAPALTSSQFHAQDELGQYSYGYAGGPSSKSEVKTADGITRGGYSYIDANNIVQSVNYVSDPVNGFRVAATNLPVPVPAPLVAGPVHIAALPVPVDDTPEVKLAKAEHFAAHAKAAIAAA